MKLTPILTAVALALMASSAAAFPQFTFPGGQCDLPLASDGTPTGSIGIYPEVGEPPAKSVVVYLNGTIVDMPMGPMTSLDLGILRDLSPGRHTVHAEFLNVEGKLISSGSQDFDVCQLSPVAPPPPPEPVIQPAAPDIVLGTVAPRAVLSGRVATFRLVTVNRSDTPQRVVVSWKGSIGTGKRALRLAPGGRYVITRRVRARSSWTSIGARITAESGDTTVTRARRVEVIR